MMEHSRGNQPADTDAPEIAGIHIRACGTGRRPVYQPILAEAFAAMYHWIFGRFSMQQTATCCVALYQAGTLSLSTTRLAMRDGQVIGVAILHLGESMGKGTFRTYWRVIAQQPVLEGHEGVFWRCVSRILRLTSEFQRKRSGVYGGAGGGRARTRTGHGHAAAVDALQWAQARRQRAYGAACPAKQRHRAKLYDRMGFRLYAPEPRPARPGSVSVGCRC